MENQRTNAPVVGAGVDGDPGVRPGVPMETAPQPVGHAHWDRPERMPATPKVLKRAGLDQLTPVYGTAVPPRGASGALRRIAYRVPEHRTTHWLLLLFADRVDALEHGLVRAAAILVPLAALAALTRRRRSWLRRFTG